MMDERQAAAPKPKISLVQEYWTTVTYRTVAVYLVLIFVIVMATFYLIFPDWYASTYRRLTGTFTGKSPAAAMLSQNQARFVNLDGRVQVKKVNSVQWAPADYSTTLDKGALVQTGTAGAARITFADDNPP